MTIAPAAADTIISFFTDTGTSADDYDAIFTGDLGEVGSRALRDLLKKDEVLLGDRHRDCGMMIFDRTRQDVHAGGSGCGCCASVLCSEIFNSMASGKLKNVLFIATGALLSATTAARKKPIPAIAHLIHFVSDENIG